MTTDSGQQTLESIAEFCLKEPSQVLASFKNSGIYDVKVYKNPIEMVIQALAAKGIHIEAHETQDSEKGRPVAYVLTGIGFVIEMRDYDIPRGYSVVQNCDPRAAEFGISSESDSYNNAGIKCIVRGTIPVNDRKGFAETVESVLTELYKLPYKTEQIWEVPRACHVDGTDQPVIPFGPDIGKPFLKAHKS